MAGHRRRKLGQLAATAICGNDITSSCLYVSGLAIFYAGKWAPLSLLFVVGVLYLFRSIYGEVVGALPLNGGAYNALLNTTSKYRASVAACLTILSYMATAVISAYFAMHYLHGLWNGLPVFGATVALLAVFMVLTIIGISESAAVAIVVFLLHMTTIALLAVFCGLYLVSHGMETLMANFALPTEGHVGKALFFGFAAAMLGVSGFESSANFVEEQRAGVFPKTLRNMWIAVTAINPLMALLALALLPLPTGTEPTKTLLADMGFLVGGQTLLWIVTVDAVLVLSGAVLTSYVGVTGLMRRLTLDRCLPQALLATNRRGTSHRIIGIFFLLNVSVLFLAGGASTSLACVYTLSFLSVMALFALGNVLLKVKRARLPRPTRSSWLVLVMAILAVLVALIGNALIALTKNEKDLLIFSAYVVGAMAVLTVMLCRIALLKALLFVVRRVTVSIYRAMGGVADWIRAKIEEINAQQIVFFSRGDNIANLNNAVLYVMRNEHTNRIKIVTVAENASNVPARMKKDLEVLDETYPSIELEFVVVEGKFSPKMIRDLARTWKIPANLMFIGSPGGEMPYDLADFGGVRLIV